METSYIYKNKAITPEEMLKLIEKLEKENKLMLSNNIRRETLPEDVKEKNGWVSLVEPRTWSALSTVIRSVCFEMVTYKSAQYCSDKRMITVQDFSVGEYMKYSEIFEKLIDVLNEYTVFHMDPAQQEENDSDILDKGIEAIRLDVRSYNALKRSSIVHVETVRDLTMLSEGDLADVRNLGSGCIRRIKDTLSSYGLHLKAN